MIMWWGVIGMGNWDVLSAIAEIIGAADVCGRRQEC